MQEEEMTFWDHVEQLRWALFRVVCVLVCLMGATLWSMPRIFDTFVLGPTSSDFFVYRLCTQWSHGLLRFDEGFSVQIININVASQFMTHINTSITFAAILTFPYFIFEAWRYIRPALFDHEVRHVRAAFLGGTLMFYVGCAVGYTLVFPFTFRFLVEYQLSAEIVNQINLQSYIHNFTMLIMIMG
ncbi:MAG: twin-arginine translocase subunit TatC, partial [Bacteroidaceae bacterium]|nr:twin-arginine translocase subunit TatC [Bacteroidaceae bacterium]